MNFHNTVLALDTTLHSCSVSLLYEKKIYSLFKLCQKNHEKNILFMIKKILQQVNITLNKIRYIACTIGPGSFTGIRISIGVSQTISIIYKIPIIGFSTLQILSEQSWRINQIKRVLIAIPISKKRIFWAKYLKNKSGLWIGIHTEKLYHNINIIRKMVYSQRGTWSSIGLDFNMNFFKRSMKLIKTKIFTPHSKDIINYTIKYLNLHKKHHTTQIYPRYLYSI
ncbi:tRNA (adenosine(37)-N6)-threonylcarbamoyltransferase complex dimerization subunit type 1 TsaB [Buchnera aphidicola]|uniref:tRNA threonylcarbamoyladenosine biosynthesis protein TsaB n=1 Tax=Buchnera aphidicola (Cinara strobi) TaxID=1921549 RepID=A0A3B1E7W0_9GAMM|nr:tRNA (adenosine(37)-N6)-threonylcarbamoyltransferase complex dimerization subunit type 1 TsaB [Buchnera aphidicola]VAX76577.1 tRNA threonylcarbamoyladenosine biosynthesis protein TsaB [Buchnera aphidicola (Cinara strobi)]